MVDNLLNFGKIYLYFDVGKTNFDVPCVCASSFILSDHLTEISQIKSLTPCMEGAGLCF